MYESVGHSFLLLTSIQLNGYTTVCLPVMDVSIVSSFWLLGKSGCEYVWTGFCAYCVYIFTSFGKIRLPSYMASGCLNLELTNKLFPKRLCRFAFLPAECENSICLYFNLVILIDVDTLSLSFFPDLYCHIPPME